MDLWRLIRKCHSENSLLAYDRSWLRSPGLRWAYLLMHGLSTTDLCNLSLQRLLLWCRRPSASIKLTRTYVGCVRHLTRSGYGVILTEESRHFPSTLTKTHALNSPLMTAQCHQQQLPMPCAKTNRNSLKPSQFKRDPLSGFEIHLPLLL